MQMTDCGNKWHKYRELHTKVCRFFKPLFTPKNQTNYHILNDIIWILHKIQNCFFLWKTRVYILSSKHTINHIQLIKKTTTLKLIQEMWLPFIIVYFSSFLTTNFVHKKKGKYILLFMLRCVLWSTLSPVHVTICQLLC